MITLEEALLVAETKMNGVYPLQKDRLVIMLEQVIEKDYAWIFPYNSQKYLATNDMRYALGGNAPIFVSKFNGQTSSFSTGLGIEEMIDAYEEEHQIWGLFVTEDIFNTSSKLLSFRTILGWTIAEMQQLKTDITSPVQKGSKTRLVYIQTKLSMQGIHTQLEQRRPTGQASDQV